ncbi:Competence protein F homolog, phosphoribosyltransferase domain; protein YhgH required for utilization of DNA as sole source of carbon and energy [hydrothermal vent metagenome]|uniref:Competence protein F homolog, phosphoribosyltransferase domain protein YhgH required for utilization of DNA as sole source of carbon and energy n=1 Tax=hydrothermal vent metagenome TaxID=652676 RepID=A0A3B0SIR1_9ZZZZ
MRRIGKLLFASSGKFRQIAGHFLPALSPLSGNMVSSPGALEPDEWQQLEFLHGQICICCGTPLPQMALPDTRCLYCESKPGILTRSRSALVYNDLSKRLILNFKHGGRTDSIQVFSGWMAHAGAELLQPSTILVPVPLHTFRRMQRKFNQSSLLAIAIARRTQMQYRPHWLVRQRNTPTQGFKSGAGRAKNVKGAFLVPKRVLPQIQGKRIVLIDDVRASGATLEACAKALLAAGAAQIDALTLARVVKPLKPVA